MHFICSFSLLLVTQSERTSNPPAEKHCFRLWYGNAIWHLQCVFTESNQCKRVRWNYGLVLNIRRQLKHFNQGLDLNWAWETNHQLINTLSVSLLWNEENRSCNDSGITVVFWNRIHNPFLMRTEHWLNQIKLVMDLRAKGSHNHHCRDVCHQP